MEKFSYEDHLKRGCYYKKYHRIPESHGSAEVHEKPRFGPSIKGFEWDDPSNTVRTSEGKLDIDFGKILESYMTTGYQAANFGFAVQRLNEMIEMKLNPNVPVEGSFDCGEFKRKKTPCTIYLTLTSSLVSSGIRETATFLAKHNMVDLIITTAGGVEEDFMKVFGPHQLGAFHLDGKMLKDNGIYRQGNILIDDSRYCHFEEFIMARLIEMADISEKEGKIWSPSSLIYYVAKRLGDFYPKQAEESIYYWCAKNNIPVFSPALTDGAMGEWLYFVNKTHKLVLDIAKDFTILTDIAMGSTNVGFFVNGGGVPKHHAFLSNCSRSGADYAVIINTSSEYDGSDSGARPDEAITWYKISDKAKPVKIYADCTLITPLLVGKTFFKFKDRYQDFYAKVDA